MIYKSASDWQNNPQKKILLFGMSGLGKTHTSNMLRASGEWFHYSIDYRIGTRYLGEQIVDNFKQEAMQNQFLKGLLKTDSIHIGSNISFDNLEPLATYLGKPGSPAKSGIEIEEYMRRQNLHEQAEIAALGDTQYFIERSQNLYGYDNFICDSGGSICEVVNPDDKNDPILKQLSQTVLLVWIKGSKDHHSELRRRFDKSPKPMCYRPNYMRQLWDAFLAENSCLPNDVNPDQFVRWAYAQAIEAREPRYRAMAENWGITVTAKDIADAKSPEAFSAMIATALEKHHS